MKVYDQNNIESIFGHIDSNILRLYGVLAPEYLCKSKTCEDCSVKEKCFKIHDFDVHFSELKKYIRSLYD